MIVGLLLVVVAAFISRKRITSSRRNKGNDYLSEAILKLLGCNIDDPENLLVYEFVPRGNLDQVLFGELFTLNTQGYILLPFIFYI